MKFHIYYSTILCIFAVFSSSPALGMSCSELFLLNESGNNIANQYTSLIASLEYWDHPAAKILWEVQNSGQAVAIHPAPDVFGGEVQGYVSNIRAESGQLVFDIDGNRYEPFYGFTVELLDN